MTIEATPELKPLNGKQRRYLRSLGHHLQALVQAGKGGISDGLIAATDAAIGSHELVKLRRSGDCPASRHELADALAAALGCHVVQKLGNTVLLYRRHPEEPVIKLPR